jgi:DNA polymerase III subunit alpha
MSRGRMFKGLDFALSRASSAQHDRKTGQRSLFEVLAPQAAANPDAEFPPGDPWPESQMLATERELLGFYISGHPLTEFEWALKKFSLVNGGSMEKVAPGTPIRMGGLVTQFEKKFSKKTQEPYARFRLEYLDGAVDVIAFPDTFREYGVYLHESAPVMVCGELAKGDKLEVRAREVYPLKEAHRHFAVKVSIHVPAANLEDARLWKVKEILNKYPGDTPVTICLMFPMGEKVFVNADRAFKVAATEALVLDLEHALGEESVYVEVSRKACKKANGGRGDRPWSARDTSPF